MINLLSATLPRAFKTKKFLFSVIILIALPALIMCVSASLGDELYMDSFPFFFNTFFPILISITGGFFMSKDHTNNTIRNKIIVGHSRENIYIANWITSALITLALFAIYLLFIFAVGVPVFGLSEDFEFGHFFKMLLLTLCPLLTYVSITVFICMTIKGTSGTIFSVMFYYALMMFTTLFEIFQNNEELLEFLLNTVVSHQLGTIQESIYDVFVPDYANFALYPISSLVVILVSTVGGIIIFKKSDIK